jgi:hypothetical protein
MSSRYDEYDDDDLDDLRRSSRRGSRRRSEDECPYCGNTDPPVIRQQISQSGWIMFAVMMFFCWPLFWIGLLMTEDYLACGDCGRKLS